VITKATGKQKTRKDEERLFELIESGLVLPCYNVLNPSISLSQTKDVNCFKLYLSDIGLFTTMIFNDSQNGITDIYKRLLSDTLPADLGYLYENVVAQELKAHGHKLFYYDNRQKGEVDFLVDDYNNLTPLPIEVKSGKSYRKHNALDKCLECKNFHIQKSIVLCHDNVQTEEYVTYMPIYMTMFMKKHSNTEPVIYTLDISDLA
jgi:predicted AAA+ superfamily ATPase